MSNAWNLEDAPSPRRERSDPAAGGSPPGAAPTASDSWALRVGHLIAGLLVLGVTLASINPWFGFFQKEQGFDARLWPWDVFAGPDGPTWAWLPPHAYLLAMLLAGFGLLACVFLAPGRLRAGLALTAFVLVGVASMPAPGGFMILAGAEVALALLLAGALACRATGRGGEGRRLMLVGWLALVIFLVFPYPTAPDTPNDMRAKAPYASPATEPLRALSRALGEPTPLIERPGEEPRPMHLGDWVRGHVINLSLLLGAVVGLWALLAGGRGGSALVLGVLLMVSLLGPAVEHALRELAEYRVSFAASAEAQREETAVLLRSAAQVLLAALRLAVLPLALGLADLLRLPRRA